LRKKFNGILPKLSGEFKLLNVFYLYRTGYPCCAYIATVNDGVLRAR